MIDEELQKSEFGALIASLEKDKTLEVNDFESEGRLLKSIAGTFKSDDIDSVNGGLHDVEIKNLNEISEVTLTESGSTFSFETANPQEMYQKISDTTVNEKAFKIQNEMRMQAQDTLDHKQKYNDRLKIRQAQTQQITSVPSDYMKRLGG
ncbi:hypothetical protein [Vibrio crassostreae]|uniref:hypothetical protein n=1 Tax=Vibrio crassostreae TaxID=246167 RepID=UPI001B306088|nr:hypothetical protein [Vibrio crassostreae]